MLVVSFSIIQIFQDWISIVSNKTEIQNLNNYYDELLAEEESLNSEVTKLHDPEYVSRYAREKYMYSLPGEFIIKMPSKDTVEFYFNASSYHNTYNDVEVAAQKEKYTFKKEDSNWIFYSVEGL